MPHPTLPLAPRTPSRRPPRLAGAALLALVLVAAGCGGSSGDKVGLIGDSITDLTRKPLTDALGTNHTVEIVGKFGARSDQVIDDVKVIAASHPDAAIINIGTNDALQQVPPEQTAANIAKILDLLGDVGCRYLVQINEGITDKASGASRAAEAKALNAKITELADQKDVRVIEWNRTIADHGGVGAVTFDTVHLSDRGIVLMADAYRTALEDC